MPVTDSMAARSLMPVMDSLKGMPLSGGMECSASYMT